jgi:hypothetical protein
VRSDVQQKTTDLSPLQSDAWAVWNKSYHVAEPEPYRALGRTLYRQDVHERIMKLFTRLDEQNEHLDRMERVRVVGA